MPGQIALKCREKAWCHNRSLSRITAPEPVGLRFGDLALTEPVSELAFSALLDETVASN